MPMLKNKQREKITDYFVEIMNIISQQKQELCWYKVDFSMMVKRTMTIFRKEKIPVSTPQK